MAATPIFSDNFNQPVGSRPDSNTWNRDNGKDPNNNNVTYTNKTDTLHVVADSGATDGKALALTINKVGDDAKGNPLFESARITTVAGDLKYGRVEASIKLPSGTGNNTAWPAFWMLGSDLRTGTSWPECGEIDIMEYRSGNKDITGTLVETKLDNNGKIVPVTNATQYGGKTGQPSFNDGKYHTFAIDWAPNSISFSVDGKVYKTVDTTNMPQFQKPFYVILNVNAFPGEKGNFTSQTMYVDYVRAYSASTPTAAPGVAANSALASTAAATAASLTASATGAPAAALTANATDSAGGRPEQPRSDYGQPV